MAKTLSQFFFRNLVRNEILTGYKYTCELFIYHVCKRTQISSHFPFVNSDLCAISFALLFICAGMYTTLWKHSCVLISFILTINTKFTNNTLMQIDYPITSS